MRGLKPSSSSFPQKKSLMELKVICFRNTGQFKIFFFIVHLQAKFTDRRS